MDYQQIFLKMFLDPTAMGIDYSYYWVNYYAKGPTQTSSKLNSI